MMRTSYSLNEKWQFLKGTNNTSSSTVTIPHTWNIEGDTNREVNVYTRKLEVSASHVHDKLYVEFLGVNSICKVYINDEYIGEHRGGYSTFRFDITGHYNWDGANYLKVSVDNRQTSDVSPLNGDFTIYGGIYRPVNLICVPRTHLALDYWGTDGVILRSNLDSEKLGILNIELHTVYEREEDFIQLEVLDQENHLVDTKEIPISQKEFSFSISNPIIWNGKENPHLYTLKVSVAKDGEIVDSISKTFGFRKAELTSDAGFFLNGNPLRINGVAKHQDFDHVGNAITNEHIEKDFSLINEIGANSVRLSHYQHCQTTYDMCDQEGYIVWAEIPMMSLPDREGVLENATNQLKELVLQNCHHPSICFWGIQNEIAMDGESIAMYSAVNSLNETVLELLPNAITASANMYHVKNNSQLNFISTMVGYNLYYGWYYEQINGLNDWLERFHEENPSVPVGISEYGADSNLQFHSEQPKVNDYTEEFQNVYHEKTYSIIESKPYVWGSYVWNMFDFGSDVRNEGGTKGKNCKGLVTFDRTIKKDAFFYYKAKWSSTPFIHICGKRFINRSDEHITIKVYSNQTDISLKINGEEIRSLTGQSVFTFENIRLNPGENELIAYSGELVDKVILMKTNQPDLSYRFDDPNPDVNVKNWFTQEQGEVDLFPADAYSILDTIGSLMENSEAWQLIDDFAPEITSRSSPGAMMTLLWVLNKMKDKFSETDIKELNSKLIKIKKN